MRWTTLVLALLTATTSLPAQMLQGVKAIAASNGSSFVLLSDGTVWTWGSVMRQNSTVPIQVAGLTGVVAIGQSLAGKADGTVWQWGANTNDMSAIDTIPVLKSGLSGVVAVAGSGYSGLALRTDGTVWQWGWYLQVGEGQAPGTPASVNGLTDVVTIACWSDSNSNLALRADGTVWQWRWRWDYSQRFARLVSDTPAPVSGLTGVVAIAQGQGHSLALKRDGTVWAWGSNSSGQLGDGTTETRTARVQVSGLADVANIASGQGHSIAVTRDGAVWAWGSNLAGQLGDGTTTDRLTPVQVSGLSGIIAVAAGPYHSLALHEDGTVWAWGLDGVGELGDGIQLAPFWGLGPLQAGALTGVAGIATGWYHSLALKGDGTVWAWGDNENGELGDGTIRPWDWYSDLPAGRAAPAQVSGLSGVTAIAGSLNLSLAVTSDGAVWAWGRSAGGIKDGKATDQATPVQVSGLSAVVSVAGAFFGYDPANTYKNATFYNLAVRGDGSLWEWGVRQVPGDDGYSVDAVALDLAPVSGLTGVEAAAAALDQNLALKRDGTVWQWGRLRPTPTEVSGLTEVVAVATACGDGYLFPCYSLALKRDGTVWAWGANGAGQLGDGTKTDRATPVQVAGLSDVVAIGTRGENDFGGGAHSVALKSDGTVWEWPVWVPGTQGQLTPTQVAGFSEIVAIAEGGGHTLALKRDGTVWAWGSNLFGALGVDTIVIRTTPVQVVGPTMR